MVFEEISERARAERLGVIRGELTKRIRPICREMPHELFLEMIEGALSRSGA